MIRFLRRLWERYDRWLDKHWPLPGTVYADVIPLRRRA